MLKDADYGCKPQHFKKRKHRNGQPDQEKLANRFALSRFMFTASKNRTISNNRTKKIKILSSNTSWVILHLSSTLRQQDKVQYFKLQRAGFD
ncbi:predicted protein [Arabidopsis lyrata subsp. lyrata]|uniref:Predicted protein n=1 Tax=Arabidopsis lyrata subsp. lyrata TaxID=81972 RepID=D7KT47_ARALL|nr:predicted protein [Arabidopsis lyrata subsp. lyrata]